MKNVIAMICGPILLCVAANLTHAQVPKLPDAKPSDIISIVQTESLTRLTLRDVGACNTCTKTATFTIQNSQPGAKQLLAVLLLAYSDGKKVTVGVATCEAAAAGWGSQVSALVTHE
jgi:phosphotransferase system HPr-like phosphotransfer protein